MANPPSPNQEDTTGSLEQTPRTLAQAESNPAHTADSTTSIWSETKTLQLVKGLEIRAPPHKIPIQMQEPVEAFPALCQPHTNSADIAAPGCKDSEATQFWSGLTSRTGGSGGGSAIIGEEKGRPGAQAARTKSGRAQKKKRWTTLQF